MNFPNPPNPQTLNPPRYNRLSHMPSYPPTTSRLQTPRIISFRQRGRIPRAIQPSIPHRRWTPPLSVQGRGRRSRWAAIVFPTGFAHHPRPLESVRGPPNGREGHEAEASSDSDFVAHFPLSLCRETRLSGRHKGENMRDEQVAGQVYAP